MHRVLLIGLALLAARPAWALDPYMWGIGPRIGTTVVPGSYPWKFSPKIEEMRENGELAEPNPDVGTSTLHRVKNDATVGLGATYYINGHSRMGALTGVGLGKQYLDGHFIVTYDWVTQTGAMDFLLGGGLGVGTASFKGEHGEEKLNIPYYPLRAQASALLRDGPRGYQGSVFAQYNFPANHHYDPVGDNDDLEVGWGFYGLLGVEITAYFGNMTPPKQRRRPAAPPAE